MGGMCQPVSTDTTSYTSVLADTQIPEWVSKGGQELFGQAKFLAEQPFQTYGGDRVADFTPTEQTALARTGTMATDATGRYNPALDMIQTSGGPFTSDIAQTYMNPYTTNVTDIAARELNRNFDIQRQREISNAIGANAFGGSRDALLQAENERNRNMALSDLYTRNLSDAYRNAQTMYGADMGRALTAGRTLEVIGTAAIRELMTSGGLERALNQQGIDAAFRDYETQREYPYQQANFAIGALKGLPYAKSTATNTVTQAPQLTGSPLSQAGGALAGLFGAYNLFGRA